MAGDWFPMQFWRSRCPEVVEVASRTGRDRHQVLGLLCDLWSYVSSESVDGTLRGVRLSHLGGVVGADDAFWAAVAAVNWLAEDDAGLVVPNWELWLSNSAKKRIQDARRQQRHRGKRHAGVTPRRDEPCDKNVTTEQDRTEEYKTEEKTPLPPAEPGGDGGPVCPAVEFVDTNLWREFAAAWDAARLPGWGKIQRTANRVGLLQQRLASGDWRARWREAVARAGRSRKCRGEDPSWACGLRLDTFLKDPDMLVRVLEGEFDDPAGGAAGNRAGQKETPEEQMARLRRERDERRKAG